MKKQMNNVIFMVMAALVLIGFWGCRNESVERKT